MSDYGPSIKLARLYEKTSKNGNVYLTGRLGGAKVAILKSREVADDGGAIWEIMLAAAPDKPNYNSAAKSNSAAPAADHIVAVAEARPVGTRLTYEDDQGIPF